MWIARVLCLYIINKDPIVCFVFIISSLCVVFSSFLFFILSSSSSYSWWWKSSAHRIRFSLIALLFFFLTSFSLNFIAFARCVLIPKERRKKIVDVLCSRMVKYLNDCKRKNPRHGWLFLDNNQIKHKRHRQKQYFFLFRWIIGKMKLQSLSHEK